MKINVVITAEDFIDFQMNYFETSDVIKKQIRKTRIIMMLIYTCIIFAFSFFFKDISFYVSSGFVLIWSIVHFIIYKDTIKSRTIKSVRKMIAGDNAKSVLGNKEYEITEDNFFTYRNISGESKFNINDIELISESERNYFLYKDKISAIIIPKKAYGQPNKEVEEFINYIKEKRLTTASS